ncbi:restriction endonuclease subunit S [Leptolyngbya sp. FACHB-1624]|nr:restriction endonuclease subunit S [Leptolyngbya sp. FACHB-1624]
MPVLPEPRAITTVLFDIDAGSAAIAACLAKTQAIAQSMMHELLTGKMRLL